MNAQRNIGGGTRADWERLQASQRRNLRNVCLYTIPLGVLCIVLSIVGAGIGRVCGVVFLEFVAALLAALGVTLTFRAIRLASRIRREILRIAAIISGFYVAENPEAR